MHFALKHCLEVKSLKSYSGTEKAAFFFNAVQGSFNSEPEIETPEASEYQNRNSYVLRFLGDGDLRGGLGLWVEGVQWLQNISNEN